MRRLKKITKKDLSYLHSHYLNFEPYSDFNVVSLWGYMVPGARYLPYKKAVLYEVTDYNTDEKSFSIFGDITAKEIISHMAKLTNESYLTFEFVPESTYQALRSWDAVVDAEEDIDNHDYVFSVESIANLSTDSLRSKKKSITKLKRRHPNLTARILDHTTQSGRSQMYRLFKLWIKQSGSNDWDREYRALQRAIKIVGFKIVCVGAFDGRRLVGFTINEVEDNGYYMGHYGKANYNYPGLGMYLEHETAKVMLANYGSIYMNLQQDMGIEGIRYYKQSLHPITQLKKYKIRVDVKKARKLKVAD